MAWANPLGGPACIPPWSVCHGGEDSWGHGCKESKAHHYTEPVPSWYPLHTERWPCPHSPSQAGQHCPGILPGYLQGADGQGRGSHWTLPFCQQGPVSRNRQARKPAPSSPPPARQPYSQRSGSWNRGPGNPQAPRCCTPAHLESSLLGEGAQILCGPPWITPVGPAMSAPFLTHRHTLDSRYQEGA